MAGGLVTAKVTEKYIYVKSPYHDEIPRVARAIGGEWDSIGRAWIFPIEKSEIVYNVYQKVYGISLNNLISKEVRLAQLNNQREELLSKLLAVEEEIESVEMEPPPT